MSGRLYHNVQPGLIITMTESGALPSLEDRIFEAKKNGFTDQEIGDKYNVNLRYIEKTITKRLGVNISSPNNKKSIKSLEPKSFSPETTTVWSFKSRGNWATHDGNYRGNWSPYIPRNIITRYSNENELILDCFCGAGTTGVESKLISRNFIGIDINHYAIELAKANVKFPIEPSKQTRVEFNVGDARNLSSISDNTIDLICTHPPYANIIHYTDNQTQDLSFCDIDVFLSEMTKVARENYRVLKKDKYCAVLIGDLRRKKNVVPLAFRLIEVYLQNGFSLKELIIKRQHNCKTTGFWYKNSMKYNFLLLAHEYLAVFKKQATKKEEKTSPLLKEHTNNVPNSFKKENLESTTVWIFTPQTWYEKTLSNLITRYNGTDFVIINGKNPPIENYGINSLTILDWTLENKVNNFPGYVDDLGLHIKNNGYLAIVCNDIRQTDGTIYPMGIKIENFLRNHKTLRIKEIIVISIENGESKGTIKDDLGISHKYLIVYQKNPEEKT